MSLVVCPSDNCVFSAPVVFRCKAPCADNGHSLVKQGKAAAGSHGSALRVGLSAPMDCVAPLDKAISILGEARLVMDADKPTGSAIIRWTDH